MKKLVAAIGIILSLFMFVGCDKKVEETLVGIEVCEEFETQVLYVGDEVDYSSFKLKLIYSTNRSINIPLEASMVSGLDTAIAGAKNVTITYEDKTQTVVVHVLDNLPKNMRFVGDKLTFYVGETPDFSNCFVKVLYANGLDEDVPLNNTNITNLDVSEATDDASFDVTFMGLTISVDYKVTYREIELNTTYDFDFLGEEYKAVIYKNGQDDLLYIKLMTSTMGKLSDEQLDEIDHNQYSFYFIADNDWEEFKIALVCGKLVVTDHAPATW